jgi:protein-S-isoprenylcysteine O-methyltransferase Ste14
VGGGPYRLVRHPIYGGLLLGLAGLALWVGSWLSLVLVVGLVGIFWTKSAEEERRLSARFPEYDGYRAVVRRRFIPWLI